jgi:hypothetical protein
MQKLLKSPLCLPLDPPLVSALAGLTQTIGGPGWFDAVLNLLGTVCDIDSGGVMPIGWHPSFRAH